MAVKAKLTEALLPPYRVVSMGGGEFVIREETLDEWSRFKECSCNSEIKNCFRIDFPLLGEMWMMNKPRQSFCLVAVQSMGQRSPA